MANAILKPSRTNKSTKRNAKKEKDGTYYVYLTMPVLVTKKRLEYVCAVLETVITTKNKTQKTSVTVTGAHVALTDKIAEPFVSAVAKAKGQIDAGVLDVLVNDALLDAVIRPLDAVVVPGAPQASGQTWEDYFRRVGQKFGDEIVHQDGAAADGAAADGDRDVTEGTDVMDVAGGLLAVAGLIQLSGIGTEATAGVVAVAVGASAAPLAIVGGAFFLSGLAIYAIRRPRSLPASVADRTASRDF
jgi:hypothetical protein